MGSLSLVLRNQVDPAPADTGGATKESLLELKALAPAAAPVRAARRQTAPARAAARDSITVIKGMDTSVQQF
ncbi:hypothetical protein JAB2_53140 [Janthinobacterium sp. HH100]|nr:hypothetical protein JAB2_53140 [Janthinobacterium sp. HH100]